MLVKQVPPYSAVVRSLVTTNSYSSRLATPIALLPFPVARQQSVAHLPPSVRDLAGGASELPPLDGPNPQRVKDRTGDNLVLVVDPLFRIDQN